jgi:pyridoxine kinase
MEKLVLTIGGSDPYAGGGVQTDLKTFENHRQFGLSVLTAIVTNTKDDFSIHSLAPELVRQQLQSLQNVNLAAIKIGLIGQVEQVKEIKEFLRLKSGIPIVVDPVMVMKEHNGNAQKSIKEALFSELAPLATLVTPNLREAEQFLNHPITNESQLVMATQQLAKMLGVAVVIKGGNRLPGADAIDCLTIEETTTIFKGKKQTQVFENGAGCAFSASLAAQLSEQTAINTAVQIAKEYVADGLKKGVAVAPNFGSFWHEGVPVLKEAK